MPVHDGKWDVLEAGEFDLTYGDLGWRVTTPEFQPHAQVFASSFDRIRFLHDLPIQLIAWADHVAKCRLMTRQTFGVELTDGSKDQDPAFRLSHSGLYQSMIGDVPDWRAFGARELEGMLDWEDKNNKDNQVAPGVQALFAAMVMGAYVALENLAGDLWVAAVDKRDALATNWRKGNNIKQFPDAFLGSGYNLSSKMGTLIRQNKMVSFTSWNDIKQAYSSAFAGALDSAFVPSGPIYLAEKTRHLFAHRSGLVDDKFRQETEAYPEYQGLVSGERLRLTGSVVKVRVEACLQCGANLLKGADQWVRTN